MRRLALAMLLVLASCGCIARDGDPVTITAAAWYIHGIVRTTQGQPVGGGTVELYRGSTRVAGGVMASQAFGFSPSETAGVYQVRYTPPAGWECVDVLSAGVGWQYPGGCVGQIALPEQAPSLGPDLVFVVAYAATPPPVPTVTSSVQNVTKTATICTQTPTPTVFIPTATPPADGWVRWDKPDAAIVNALVLEWEWWLEQFDSDDPFQLAANETYGAAWPLGAPHLTHYVIAGTAVRWQCFITPRGVVFAMATPAEPYRVALIEW